MQTFSALSNISRIRGGSSPGISRRNCNTRSAPASIHTSLNILSCLKRLNNFTWFNRRSILTRMCQVIIRYFFELSMTLWNQQLSSNTSNWATQRTIFNTCTKTYKQMLVQYDIKSFKEGSIIMAGGGGGGLEQSKGLH